MSTPIRSVSARTLRVTTLGAAACIVPALLASAGIVSSIVGRVLGAAIPLFLVLSVALFSRAHYLLWVKGHGSPFARTLTVLLTIAAAALWAYRLRLIIGG